MTLGVTFTIRGPKAKLAALSQSLNSALLTKMRSIVLRLQAHIQKDKLSGQVLKVKTGALRRSITSDVDKQGSIIKGKVFSSGDVKYAAIHEFGGKTKAHDIYPRKAEALAFMMGGKQVFAKVVHHPGSVMPERSFMRSGLSDMKQQFINEVQQTISKVVKANG